MSRFIPQRAWSRAKPRLPRSVVIAKRKRKKITVARGRRHEEPKR